MPHWGFRVRYCIKKMSKLVVTLSEEALLELQTILIDEDKEAALQFLQTRLASKIPQKGTASCDSSRLNPYLLRPGGFTAKPTAD